MSQELLELAVTNGVAAHEFAHDFVEDASMLAAFLAYAARIVHDDQRHHTGNGKIGAVEAILDACRGGKASDKGRMATGHSASAKEDMETRIPCTPPIAGEFVNLYRDHSGDR